MLSETAPPARRRVKRCPIAPALHDAHVFAPSVACTWVPKYSLGQIWPGGVPDQHRNLALLQFEPAKAFEGTQKKSSITLLLGW